MRTALVCLLLAVMTGSSYATGTSNDDWDDKMKQLLVIHQENVALNKIEPREGTEYFQVGFVSPPVPASVHRLRPEDVSVVGALGDSITAANGAGASSLPGVIVTYRGMSWTVGGDDSLDEYITIPNILRHYNPNIKGYSEGVGTARNGFNAAVPGARAEDMRDQAEDMVQRMRNSTDIDFENDWKIVSIFIGGNDLCDLTDESSRPENYVAKLKEGLDYLHQHLPRALVNVVEILDIYLLPQVAHGYGSTAACRAAQKVECPYVANADDEELEYVREETRKYQEQTEELIASGRYDTRDDFTVVLQPFFRDTELPYTEDGEVDATFFAPDCFHFSSKGHGMGAINLWNNMLEPVGKKTTTWSVTDLKVPSKEHPYFFTSKNSNIDESQSCPSSTSLPDWFIAVLAVLAAGLLIEAIVLVTIVTGRKSNNNRNKPLVNEKDPNYF